LEDGLADIDRMSSFLMTMLGLARLESKVIPLKREPTDIVATLRGMISDMEPLWLEKRFNIMFTLRIGQRSFALEACEPRQPLPDEAARQAVIQMVDPVMLPQAFMNILSNAFRHCPVGGTIQVWVGIASPEYPNGCRITLTNDGPPIPEADLERIFDRFYRGGPDKNSEDKPGGWHSQGFGLGLSIARGVVELHRGSLRAYNPPEGGACFEINLPATEVDQAPGT
jgi:signal transduction histidine kinase